MIDVTRLDSLCTHQMWKLFAAGMLLVLSVGCSSGDINLVSQNMAAQGEVIAPARGEACGHKIISLPGALALDFIPIMFNSRLERAMQQAVLSVPGARSIQNISIEEKWYYWLLGTTRCVIVTGEAVK